MHDPETVPKIDLHGSPPVHAERIARAKAAALASREREPAQEPEPEQEQETEPGKKTNREKKPARPKHLFQTPAGVPFKVPKFFADTLRQWHGTTTTETGTLTVYDPENPFLAAPLPMGKDSPICKKCLLFENGCKHPFFKARGPERPVVTIIYEGVLKSEDDAGELVHSGHNYTLRLTVERRLDSSGIKADQIRWLPLTRCASRDGHLPNYRVKGNWCRHFLIQDILLHPPRMIIPVGTAVLGLLSHKSNAQDWQGRVLTYRGWPDDWLCNPDFVEPREHPADPSRKLTGHPLMGAPPENFRIPMVPIVTVRLALANRTTESRDRWQGAIEKGLELAANGVKANVYKRPWYRFVNDPDDVCRGLSEMLGHKDLLVCYDTETTGLKPLAATASIVSMMFRWNDPASGNPRSLGFPWNFRSKHYENRVEPHILRLAPLVLRVLTECRIVCHNAAFDMLYSFFNLPNANLDAYRQAYADEMGHAYDPRSRPDANEWEVLRQLPEFNRQWDDNLCAMAKAFQLDTWHMAFALRQDRGSLGLELLTYDYAPTLAGYEEEMTLLIERKQSQLHPGAKEQDPDDPPHYLNISEDYYPTHVIPYVMGDVEACYQAREALQAKLDKASKHKIPLADPARAGHFRHFSPLSRSELYAKIMAPAAGTLMRLMARGMYVDEKVLTHMEGLYPRMVDEKKLALKENDPDIASWCEEMENAQRKPVQEDLDRAKEEGKPAPKAQPKWEMDLENKSQLRDILFTVKNLPISRLTKKGRQLFGENSDEWTEAVKSGEITREDLLKWAAIDKFTLNMMAASYPEIRSLQGYRQLYKLYTTYVRPLRNLKSNIDKKKRTGDAHLCVDSCIHASFLLATTRSGRLSSRDPNLQNLPSKGDIKQMFTSRFLERGCIYQSDLCLAHGQRVWTRRGTVKIESVLPGDEVEQEDGSWRAVQAVLDRGVRPVFKLTTEGGYTVVATREHRFRIVDENGDYVWRQLGALKHGDYVAIQPGRAGGWTVELERLPAQPEITRYNQTPIVTPKCANQDFCFWYGYMLGNGSVNSESGAMSLCVCGTDQDVANHLVAVTERFGLGVSSTAYRGAIDLGFCSVLLSRWLETTGFDKKSVPEWVYRLDSECIFAFLRGLFESDGSAGVATADTRTNGQRISFCSTHRSFAAEIQILLLAIGIHAGLRFCANDGNGGWHVGIRADSAPDFARMIGFKSKRKNSVLTDYIERVAGGKKFGLPNQQACFQQAGFHGEAYRLTNNTRVRGSKVSTACARAVLEQADIPDETRRRLDRFIGSRQRYEKVDVIEYVGDRPTCDIQVEDTETFVVGGFVSHNSQIELRLMASACGDETMLRAYRNKMDLHTLTASRIYNLPYEHFSKEHFAWLQENGKTELAKELELKRRVSKTCNFLTGYGGGAFGLQTVLANSQVYKSIEECEDIIALFFDSYPSLRSFLGFYKRFIEDSGRAVSIFGRVRILEDARSSDNEVRGKALRAGCNHVIQSTASDMMLIALTVIEDMMRAENLESVLVSTVHDSLVIDAVRDELPAIHAIVHPVLNNFDVVLPTVLGAGYDTSWMLTPFAGDCEVGVNYYATRKIPDSGSPDWDKLLSTEVADS